MPRNALKSGHDWDDLDKPDFLDGVGTGVSHRPPPIADNPFATGGGAFPSGLIGPAGAVAVTAGGITFNLLYDAAAMAAPAAFRAGIEQAASTLSAAFSDHITLNIKIDYSGTGGGAAAGPDQGLWESYSTVRSELVNNATPGDTTFNSLPGGATIQGQSTVAVWNAQLKVFGLLGANDTTTDDGSATFATDIDPALLVGVAMHELTHAMGRIPYGSQPDIFDFFRFTSTGTMLFSGNHTAPAAYFSLDGGVTKLADYGRTSDVSDFLNSGVQGPNDQFNEYYSNRSHQTLSAVDLKQMDALGYHLASSPGALFSEGLVQDTGSSATDHITANAALTGSGDANATVSFVIDNNPIATTATVDPSGHWSFTPTGLADGVHVVVASETAGGTGSGSLSFTLDTHAPNVAITSEVLGTNGKLALSGTSDTAGTVSIVDGSTVVGTASVSNGAWSFTVARPSDTIHTFTASETDTAGNAGSSNVALLGSTGNDSLTGTAGANSIVGNSGNDTIVGGGGGDTLTGNGGSDTFKYTSLADSQPGAGHFDTITDFVHGTDKIDLTAIGGPMNVVTATSTPATIAAHTIEIVASGGSTVVYVNASGASQSTSAADMEIHLTGVNNATSADILHV